MSEITLAGPNILLMGPSGTGKTFALGTLTDWAQANGKEMFVLFTESGTETLLGYWTDVGLPPFNRTEPLPIPPCLHWHQQTTRPLPLTSLIDAATKVGMMSYDAVTKMQDMNRSGDNNALLKIYKSCSDFPDDRTGKTFGSIDSWTSDRIFVIDSLSELANACMKHVIGNKPTAAPPDYGVAQNSLMNFLRLCTQATQCTFVMTAHVDKQTDEISGMTKTMVKSIGKALAGDIPPLFSDVIYTVRDAAEFFWDTAAYGVDCKTRSLGYRSKIRPDFAQIMNVWKGRGGK